MAKRYSDDLRERAVAAIESARTREEVAELYNLASSTVGGFIRRKRETGSVSPAKFDGHKTFVFAPHTDLVLCLLAIEPDAAGRYAQTYSYLLASRLLMKRSAVGGLTPNGSFDRLLASQWTRRRGPETMAITIDRGKASVMPDELRPDLVYAMADAVDKMLLSWEPAPSLSEAISALVQSLARALSATTDPGPSLATVKDGVEHLLVKFCAPGAANQIDFELQSAPDIPQFMPFHSPRSIFRIEEQSHFHIGIRSSLSCSATWLLIVAGHFLSSGAATRMILSPFSSVLSTRFAHPRDHILAVRADPVFYNLPLRLPPPDLQ